MQFDIITIFPHIFDSYLNESIIKRAQKRGLIKINIVNLRNFASDKSRSHSDRGSSTKWSGHRTVDDKPYGGGPGMVFKIEPMARAIGSILKLKIKNPAYAKASAGKQKSQTKIILFSASGKQFNSKMATEWAKKYNRIIMIAGHYEGIDGRIKKVIGNWKLKIENLSIGPYVLTGGELPAMVVVDAVSRHISGVLGKGASLEEKRYGVGVPVYTRPAIFQWKNKKYAIPKVLLSGDHKKIENWRKKRETIKN